MDNVLQESDYVYEMELYYETVSLFKAAKRLVSLKRWCDRFSLFLSL